MARRGNWERGGVSGKKKKEVFTPQCAGAEKKSLVLKEEEADLVSAQFLVFTSPWPGLGSLKAPFQRAQLTPLP